MNYDFGRLDENKMMRYAPDSFRLREKHTEEYEEYENFDSDGNPIGDPVKRTAEWYTERVVLHPTAEDYAKCSPPYLPNENTVAEPPEGQTVVGESWDTDGAKNFKVYTYGPMPEPMPRRWTPLTIKRGAVAKGWWDGFKAVLQSEEVYDDFLMCQFIAEDDPTFDSLYGILCSMKGKDSVDSFLGSLPTEEV